VISAHAIEVLLVDVPVDSSTFLTRGALGSEWTDVAHRVIGLVDDCALGVLGGLTPEGLSIGAAVGVRLRIIGEAGRAEVLGSLVPIR
jgi:hypothetical protein